MKQLLPVARAVTDDDLFDLYDEPGPHLRAGFVSSLDGAVAVGGRSGPLSHPADKAVFRALRAVSDAVVVGAGTARVEDYGPVLLQPAAVAWRAEHGRSAAVPLVVVSRSGQIPSTARFFAGPVIVAVPDGVDVPGVPGEVVHASEPSDLVALLHDRGFTRLLCEGGPSLLTAYLKAGVVDELCLTTSGLLVGEEPSLVGPLGTPVSLELTALLHDDPGVLLGRWRVVRSAS